LKKYMHRMADDILEKKLRAKGAVLIEGPKWCGKTTTAKQHAKSVLSMQKPDEVEQNLEMAQVNPSRLLAGDTPRLIDEWQMAPKLWDAVRFEIDERDEFNQFILTGSAVPADMSQIYHTGTGRISRMLMRPMSLFESEDSSGEISLCDIFAGEDISAENKIDLGRLAFLICRGGWPKAVGVDDETALMQAEDYYEGVVYSDINRVDNIKRDSEKVRRLLRSYAKNIGTQAKITTVMRDIREASKPEEISKNTLFDYVKALKKIFVIEDSLAWNPSLRSKVVVRSGDTRYFTDPSIGTAALGLGPEDLMGDLATMGLMFENLCIRDLRVYAETLKGNLYHYKDKNGLECDAVIHLKNRRYGLIEIKLGGEGLIEEGVKTLNILEGKIDTDIMPSPSFKMILTGVGTYAYRRKDGIYIVPIGCLRP